MGVLEFFWWMVALGVGTDENGYMGEIGVGLNTETRPNYQPVEVRPLDLEGREQFRQRVVDFVGALERRDNQEKLMPAISQMFEGMGVTLSEDLQHQNDMNQMATHRYEESWYGEQSHEQSGTMFDCEVITESGAWLNMQFVLQRLPGGIRCVQVMPGGCSLEAYNLSMPPVSQAYAVMEQALGRDPWNEPVTGQQNGFYVIGGKYYRVPEGNVARVMRGLLKGR